MGDAPLHESDENHDEDEICPNDLVFVLTPAFHIYRRVEPQGFIDFLRQFNRIIEERFQNQPAGNWLEIQVAYALLPGGENVFDVQLHPPDSLSTVDIERLINTIGQIPAPEIIGGPVAFFRRGTFGKSPVEQVNHGMPFVNLCSGPETVSLDELLMRIAKVPVPSRTLWGKVSEFFRSEVKPARSIAEQDIFRELSKQVRCTVIWKQWRYSSLPRALCRREFMTYLPDFRPSFGVLK